MRRAHWWSWLVVFGLLPAWACGQTLNFDEVCAGTSCSAGAAYQGSWGVTFTPAANPIVTTGVNGLSGTNGGKYLSVQTFPYQATINLPRPATSVSLDVAVSNLVTTDQTITLQALNNGTPVGAPQAVQLVTSNIWVPLSVSVAGGFNSVFLSVSGGGANKTFGVDNVHLGGNCSGFTDVQPGDAFCSAAEWLYNRGITLGCTLGQFCPFNNVTRAQMALFLSRMGQQTYLQGGNAFGTAGVLGTLDTQPLSMIVGGAAALRLLPASPPNVALGSASNDVLAGVRGASIGGGGSNNVIDVYGTVSGGLSNRAGNVNDSLTNGGYSTVGGGQLNVAEGYGSSVGGGFGNLASGTNATVPGGNTNAARGDDSFAAGRRGNAAHPGCFIWSDSSSGNPTSCFLSNEFVARSLNGFYFWTSGSDDNTYAGARLGAGSGAWAAYSDVNGKENFQAVDSLAVLNAVAAMPIATWNWKAQGADVRHIGPTAQDFRAGFGLGDDDRTITTVDADGVALAAIQGLNLKLEAKQRELDTVKAALAELRSVVESLRRVP